MKQEPIKSNIAPSYPTLYQVNKFPGRKAVPKVAAVAAVTATMALASGCGDSGSGTNYKVFKTLSERRVEETAIVLDGDVIMPTDTDPTADIELAGEEPVEVLEGEMPMPTDEDYTDPTIDDSDMVIQGMISYSDATYEG